MSPILTAAREKRDKAQAKLDALLEAPTTEARELTADEVETFEKLSSKVVDLDRQIDLLVEEEKRAEKAAAATVETPAAPLVEGAARVRSQMTYDEREAHVKDGNSFLRDLAVIAVAARRMGETDTDPQAALERLQQHQREIDIEARNNPEVAKRLQEARLEQRVNPNTTAGTGGEFVPPLWLVSQYVPFLRAGRKFANRVRNLPLPPGIDIINVPKITLGSLTAIQTANAAAVASQDITTSTVSAKVNTIAGQEDISLQLLEQSPLAMDNVIFDDLSRDYDKQLDTQVITGSGASGQHKGVLNVTGATTNTSITNANLVNCSSTVFHDASTAGTQYRSILNGVNQIETLRFDSPTGIWVHPRRANSWGYSAVDSNNRPLFIPAKYGQFNVVGLNEGAPVPEGVAGELYGLPVVKDANMVTVANGTASPSSGGSQDPIVVLKEDDLILWEGTMRMRALPEILSGTLQIRFQVYAYSAFMPDRFPPSISILVGAGCAAPGF